MLRYRRSRRLELTPAGRAILAKAYPVWCEAHGEIEAMVSPSGAGPMRNELTRLVKVLERSNGFDPRISP